MEKKSVKHKYQHLGRLHGKYKRYAAAVAGAAIMAGVALPGIPVAKVLAAENPATNPTAKSLTNQVDKDNATAKPPGRGWHEHKDSWPSPDENQAWYQDGRIYYRSNTDRDLSEYAYYLNNPVNFVKSNADMYGFDPYLDSFRLLSLSHDKALVEVTKHDTGRLFDIVLERTNDRDWIIVEARAL